MRLTVTIRVKPRPWIAHRPRYTRRASRRGTMRCSSHRRGPALGPARCLETGWHNVATLPRGEPSRTGPRTTAEVVRVQFAPMPRTYPTVLDLVGNTPLVRLQ